MNSNKKENLTSKNWISRLFFFYMNKVIIKGSKKIFEKEDLYKIKDDLIFSKHKIKFDKFLNQKTKSGWSFKKIIFRWMLKFWAPIIILYTIMVALSMTVPFLLKLLIEWFQDPDSNPDRGYILFAIITVISLITPFFAQHGMKNTYDIWVKCHIVLFHLYFKKIKEIKINVSNYIDMGKIANILTADIHRIGFLGFMAHRLFLSPIQLFLYTYFIYREIKWVAFVGLGFIILVTFLQGKISFSQASLLKKKYIFADKRNKKVNNSLNGITSVKYNAWETVILNIIRKTRLKETHISFLLVLIRSIVDGIIFLLPIFSSLLVIVIYQKTNDNNLTLSQIFFIINIYNEIVIPLTLFFFALSSLFEAKISLKRINDILKYPNMDKEKNAINNDDEKLEKGSLIINNGTFSYDELKWKIYNFVINNKEKTEVPKFEIKNVLTDINFKVKKGEFIAIIGSVGSGKSSLLKSFLGMLFKNKGEIKKNGSFGYVPQNAFLINEVLRENILFGEKFDEVKYKEIIRKCQLLPDLQTLKAKDLTEIGERGINLSGGQKQRISLARSVYANSDIYLIDDSLSALDAHVGKKIFNEVFCDILKDKTRIMVTHALQYLPNVDRIIFMEKGKILFEGTYENLIEKNEKFKKFVTEEKTKKIDKKEKKENESFLDESFQSIQNIQSLRQMSINLKDIKSPAQQEGKLIKQEKRFKGTINLKIYKTYLKEGGWLYFAFNMLFFILSVIFGIFIDYWVGAWTVDTYGLSENTYIYIYLGIAVMTLFFIFVRGITWGHYTSKISFGIFQKFVDRLLLKSMAFFDTTPIGQILNLTSKDTDYMDTRINLTYLSFFSLSLQILGTFVLIAITNILIIPFIIIFLIIFIFVVRLYLKTSLELRRLELLSFSPILSNLAEFFNGLSTFRALKKTDYMNHKFNYNVDNLCTIMYHDRMCQAYINLIVQFMMGILIGLMALFIVLSKNLKFSFVLDNPDVIAVSLNAVLVIPARISFFMFNVAELIKGMNSIQRIILNLEDENNERNHNTPIAPKNWPLQGQISAKNFNIRYRKGLPLVLKNVSFDIKGSEKIGIVGRTGSGKSTLIKAITRLLEIDNEKNGYIEIDGVKINDIGLNQLRSKINVIPQEPFLFQGTLRENIDPLEKYSDEEIIITLKKAFLWDSDIFTNSKSNDKKENQKKEIKMKIKEEGEKDIEKLGLKKENIIKILTNKDKLEFIIESKGLNLSNGQRQLVCIARSIIEKPKILLMDEATSNIDPNTDKKLHHLIKKEFRDSTIITIAHRLDTIIDYDRVFVFDKGELVESGTPFDFLKDKNSIFNQMVRENGKEFYERMINILNKNLDD